LILFLPVYSFYLKESIIGYILNTQSTADLKYYKGIFQNGEVSIILIIIFLSVVLHKYYYIKNILEEINLKKILIYCITFQVIVQVVNLYLIETIQHSDSYHYLQHGIRLAQSNSYLSEYYFPTAFWPVGIPAIIAFFYKLNLPIELSFQIMNIILANFLLLIFYLLFKKILTENQLKLFLVLYVLYPNNLFISQSVLTELPYIFLIWLSLLITSYSLKTEKSYFFIIVGVIIGIATLIRSNAFIILFLYIFLASLFTKSKVKIVLLLMIGFLIIVTPWSVRNYLHFNSLFITSTNGGYNFLMGNHLNSKGNVNFNFEYDFKNSAETQEERKAYKKAIDDLTSDPSRIFSLIPQKVFWSYWRGDHALTWALKVTKNDISDFIKSFLFFFTNSYFYFIIVLSFIYFFYFRQEIPKTFITSFIRYYFYLA
jgi:hypothetical protein